MFIVSLSRSSKLSKRNSKPRQRNQKRVIPTQSQFVASHTHVVTRARLHKITRVFAVIWLSPWTWPEVVSRELCDRHYDVAWKGVKEGKKEKRGGNEKKQSGGRIAVIAQKGCHETFFLSIFFSLCIVDRFTRIFIKRRPRHSTFVSS